MNNNNKFNLGENFMWICILCISIFSYFLNSQYILLLIFWLIIVIINGNIKRIESVKYENITMLLRRSLFVMPLFFPLIVCFEISITTGGNLIGSLVGIIFGLLFIVPKINTWKFILHKDFIKFTTKRIKLNYISQWFMYFLGSIGEEIFFRAFIIGYVCIENPIIGVLLSTILFFLNHFGLKWKNEFSFYDYIIEILFGIVSSCLFLFTGSILPSITMHLTYNFPIIFKSYKEFKYHYL